MSADTFTLPGRSGSVPGSLLVTLDYSTCGVTFFIASRDYIDLRFAEYQKLLSALLGWVTPADDLPAPGDTVLLITKQGGMHMATRTEDGHYKGSQGHRIDNGDVQAWALKPPFFPKAKQGGAS